MPTVTNDEMYNAVYKHLYAMNEHIVGSIFNRITPELEVIMSNDAYAEMIQMAQSGYIKDYYNRLLKGAV